MLGETYKKYDGLGLGELVKTKQVKSEELVEAAINQIEQLNPSLNAVVNKFYERDPNLRFEIIHGP